MLKFFFNRNSFMVKAAFWGAALLTLVFFLKGGWFFLSIAQKILLSSLLFQVAFAKGIDLYPWYPKEALGPGIRLQFQKALVPVTYLWLASVLFLWLKPLTLLLALFNLLLLPIGGVACILIHFHRMDPDPSEPNILSSAKPLPPAPSPLASIRSPIKEPVSP